jgi:peptidoglycan/LPS O-acetylase OafA/YrhL
MDFSTKRHYKKMAKIYFAIAWSLAITWMLYIVACFVIIIVTPHLNQPTRNEKVSFLFFLLFLLPFITAVVLGYIGQEYLNKRIRYLRQIKEYRQRKFFTDAITLLRSGNISGAIYILDELLTDHVYRKFIVPFIICENTHSIEDERRELGNKKLDEIVAQFNPDKMLFES